LDEEGEAAAGAFADFGDEAEAGAAEDELYMGFAEGIVESTRIQDERVQEMNQHADCGRPVTRLFGVLGAFCTQEKQHSLFF